GSLYTSVLPNLLVDGIRRAIEMSKALKVYVCNVATQHGETDAFSVSDHCQALYDHVNDTLFHYVVANDNITQNGLPKEWQAEPVRIDRARVNGTAIVAADVISEENRYHHDTEKLASTLMGLYYQRRQTDRLVLEPVEEREPQEAALL
ncbi:MAG: 2-phospho-L-lactate transferase CofD family protein, partial [Dehalococcoidia bacterium]|nr:2-phospho-L-lactate transferase CofD family protein [Dehalococcoidia bacterium]